MAVVVFAAAALATLGIVLRRAAPPVVRMLSA
jgi:hypothetical protein